MGRRWLSANQRQDKPHRHAFRSLRGDRAVTILPENLLHAEYLRFGDPGHIAECDFQALPVDDAEGDGSTAQPMVWIDAGQTEVELALDIVDARGGQDRTRFARTATALRRMPRAPGRENGVSPKRASNSAVSIATSSSA